MSSSTANIYVVLLKKFRFKVYNEIRGIERICAMRKSLISTMLLVLSSFIFTPAEVSAQDRSAINRTPVSPARQEMTKPQTSVATPSNQRPFTGLFFDRDETSSSDFSQIGLGGTSTLKNGKSAQPFFLVTPTTPIVSAPTGSGHHNSAPDVNQDGTINPVDALSIINHLNPKAKVDTNNSLPKATAASLQIPAVRGGDVAKKNETFLNNKNNSETNALKAEKARAELKEGQTKSKLGKERSFEQDIMKIKTAPRELRAAQDSRARK